MLNGAQDKTINQGEEMEQSGVGCNLRSSGQKRPCKHLTCVETHRRTSHEGIWEKNIPNKGKSIYKTLRREGAWENVRNSQKVSVAGAERARGAELEEPEGQGSDVIGAGRSQ